MDDHQWNMQQRASGLENMVIGSGTLLLQPHTLLLNCSVCWVYGNVSSFWMYNFLPAALSWQISLVAGVWNLIDWLALMRMVCCLETAPGLSSNCRRVLQLSTILASLYLALPKCRIQPKLMSQHPWAFFFITLEKIDYCSIKMWVMNVCPLSLSLKWQIYMINLHAICFQLWLPNRECQRKRYIYSLSDKRQQPDK